MAVDFLIPAALGDKAFHPFGDFLLHDVGTGDGIVVPVIEHYGRAFARCRGNVRPKTSRRHETGCAPRLYGACAFVPVNARRSVSDLPRRHPSAPRRSGSGCTNFRKLAAKDQQAILEFLRSL